MHYSNDTREKVRNLRRFGFTLDEITQKMNNIPRTTIHLWIKEIQLSEKQISEIRQKALDKLQRGRVRSQTTARLTYEKLAITQTKSGIDLVGNLSKRDLLVAGAALYWGEGFKNKHERRLGFCNTDPQMIRFYIWWLSECFGVAKEDLSARLSLNISYKERTEEIESYWSILTGVPLSQFTKPFYQKGRWEKTYTTTSYKGVLRIHVKNSWNKLVMMRAMIQAMKDQVPQVL